jgi:hypothetical protein
MLAIPVKQTSVVTLLTNYHSYWTSLNIFQTYIKTAHFKSSFDSNDLYNDNDNDNDDDDNDDDDNDDNNDGANDRH